VQLIVDDACVIDELQLLMVDLDSRSRPSDLSVQHQLRECLVAAPASPGTTPALRIPVVALVNDQEHGSAMCASAPVLACAMAEAALHTLTAVPSRPVAHKDRLQLVWNGGRDPIVPVAG